MINFDDTICAPATSVGTGAISIIRVSGPESFDIVDRTVHFLKGDARSSRGYVLKRGTVQEISASGTCETVDDVLAGIFRSPSSYTGEDSVEIYCHASNYITGRILALLVANGCRMAEPGEFTRRAYINGKMDLAQAEAVADVIASSSETQHRVAMNQLRGGYSAKLAEIRSRLLELSSLMELELDFSEEDVEFADRAHLRSLLDEAILACTTLADSFRLGNAIRNGVPVAIVGAPNSGKSTLLNALLQDERAIVSDIPGTTRDTIEETCIIDGTMFRFIDTAGIRDASDDIERKGIERAYRKAGEASIILGLLDPTSEVEEQLENLLEIKNHNSGKFILLVNKCDLKRQEDDTESGRRESQETKKPQIGIDNIGDGVASKNVEEEDIFARNKNVKHINNFVLSHDNKSFTADRLEISAKEGIGLGELREKLSSFIDNGRNDAVLVTNARHAEALRLSSEALESVRDGLAAGLSPDLLAEDLRSALSHLGTITGEITTDEILGEIFGRFCIGK